MRRVSLILVLSIFGCEDDSIKEDVRLLRDKGASSYTPSRTVGDVEAPKDQSIPVDFVTQIIQARPIVDAEIDAAPPPRICQRLGMREDCNIPGLQGPCAVGKRICNVTSWSECLPFVFPRIETCDAIDNDCDGRNNEAPNSQNELLSRSCYTGAQGTDKNGPCRSGVSFCEESNVETDAGVEIQYMYGECQNEIVPRNEACDGNDNDCDNSIDEGVLNACGECGLVPIEICDGFDNNCDGEVDENLLNDCGACGPEPRELCDFLDNDCDGEIDENFEEGACNCDHPDYVPQPETCNAIDDDCDDAIDEGLLGGPLTKLCSTEVLTGEVITYERREDGPQYVGGVCRLGIAFCEEGMNAEGVREKGYFDCLQEVSPGVERCDDLDNDCDGISDEDFDQGNVAVMMIVDVSGSMNEQELAAAFNATRNSVQRLFDDNITDVCYMLAVVGNDDRPDPYLFYPADNCVPGIEDPPVVPIEDMSNAVNTLRLNIIAGIIDQGGSTENTLDALGRFFTDDLIDWDNDGIPESILWSTSRPQAALQGMEDSWDVDLSQYTHRLAIVLGDEPAQGDEWGAHDVARAMAHSGSMAFIIGNRANVHSYQPLVDFGAVHIIGLDRFGGNRAAENAQTISDAVVAAIDEAACINNRQAEEEDVEEEEEEQEEEMACVEREKRTIRDWYVTVSTPFLPGYKHHYLEEIGMCL
jgi:hypothetical protein